MTTTSRDISGGSDTSSHQCHVQVTGKGGVHTCKHKGSYFEEGKHWCRLHAPSNVAKKKARKAAKEGAEAEERAAKLAAKQAPLDGEDLDGEEPEVAAVAAVKLPETVEEAARTIIVLATEAQSALARVSNMTSRGWPENTPAENFKVMLQTVNDEAERAAEEIRGRIAKARQILDPVGYPNG